jgi:hypothetical protein
LGCGAVGWSILPVFWITDHSQPRSSSTASKKSGAEKLGFLLPAPVLIVRYELWADSEPGGVHRIRYLPCGWDEDIPPIPCAVILEPLSDRYIARFLCCEKISCLSSFSLLRLVANIQNPHSSMRTKFASRCLMSPRGFVLLRLACS